MIESNNGITNRGTFGERRDTIKLKTHQYIDVSLTT